MTKTLEWTKLPLASADDLKVHGTIHLAQGRYGLQYGIYQQSKGAPRPGTHFNIMTGMGVVICKEFNPTCVSLEFEDAGAACVLEMFQDCAELMEETIKLSLEGVLPTL